MREGKSGIYCWYNDPEKNKENQYQVYMMNTAQTLSGRHWNPFLYVLSKSEKLTGKVSLEEYGARLSIIKPNQKVECKNDHWAIYNDASDLVHTLPIKQENNTDTEDRLELISRYLTA